MTLSADSAAVLAAVSEIFARVTNQPALVVDMSRRLDAIERLDSLRLLETIALAEEHFGVAVDTSGFGELETVADIVRLLSAARQG